MLVYRGTLTVAAIHDKRQGTMVKMAFWTTGDFHTHTFLTDGNHTLFEVARRAFEIYGLDWIANSEHGGSSSRGPAGMYWENSLGPEEFEGILIKDEAGRRAMWRWQSLRDYSFPLVERLRDTYPNNVIIQGVEWNMPCYDHVSVGIAADEPVAISDFEYMFDQNDEDASRIHLNQFKRNSTREDAIAGVRWLNEHYRDSSYAVINHPSRAMKYAPSDLRDLNNASPDVCFGFEGLPGRQKKSFGCGYSQDFAGMTPLCRTYGGADPFLATIGGVWDSLLGEGRRFWVLANSDFHEAGSDSDFYPGEYAKNYVKVDENSPKGIVDGLRSGNCFVVHGDLIDHLDFWAECGSSAATMGESIWVPAGSDVVVTVRLRSPHEDGVDHVDLIAGRVSGLIVPEDARYNVGNNPSTHVVARFFTKGKLLDDEGFASMSHVIRNVRSNMYVRLRGTNLPVGAALETDFDGDPLSDDLAHLGGYDNEMEAYHDLWFYSNPINIRVEGAC